MQPLSEATTRRFYSVALFLLAVAAPALLAPSAQAQTPYQPSYTDPLTEIWRWQAVEALGTSNALILPDNRKMALWIIKMNGDIYHYDGYETNTISRPTEGTTRALKYVTDEDHSLLALEESELYRFDGNDWNSIAELPNPLAAPSDLLPIGASRFIVGHRGGLASVSDGKVVTYPFEDPGISGVLSMTLGRDQAIYAATAPDGDVYRCPIQNGTLSRSSQWERILDNKGQTVQSADLLTADDRRIWYVLMNENDGALAFDPSSGEWDTHDLRMQGGENFHTNVSQSHDGKVWVVGRSSLQIYDGREWGIYKAPQYPIPDSRPALTHLENGILFLLDFGAGVTAIDYDQQRLQSIKNLHFQAQSKDSSNWFLHVDGSVVRENPLAGRWERHSIQDTGVTHPVALIALQNGDILCTGSKDSGAAFSIFDGESWDPQFLPAFARSFSPLGIVEFSNGDVYLGSGQNESEYPNIRGGMIRLKRHGDRYTVEHLSPGAVPYRSWSIAEDLRNATIWASGHGLFHADPPQQMRSIDELDFAWIDHIASFDNGDLWAAVWGQGVYRYRNGQVEDLTNHELFPEIHISSIHAYQEKYPIVTTDKGVFRYDGTDWYPYLVPQLALHRGGGTIKESQDGAIYFNKTHTDWYYRGLPSKPYPEKRIELFNTTKYIPDTQGPKTHIVTDSGTIFPEGTGSIQWQGHDYYSKTPADRLTYSYKIDDTPWTPFSHDTELSLVGFKGGEHTIQIRARDTEFNLQETPVSTSFQIIVPIWRQPWFVWGSIAIAVIVIGMLAVIFRQRMRHLLELERVKGHFLSNISHELRTPLTLIRGPVEKLLDDSNLQSKQSSLLRTIETNTSRLLQLIDQLLEFQSVEKRDWTPNPKRVELYGLVTQLLESFVFVASENRQQLILTTRIKSLHVQMDADLFSKIFNNLIHNAVKYSGEGSTIDVRLYFENIHDIENKPPHIRIDVSDNGPGISPSVLKKVFKPFYRENSEPILTQSGYGIGLALVREHVSLLGGTIRVESPVHGLKNGTRFSVFLPAISPGIEQEVSPVRKDFAHPDLLQEAENQQARPAREEVVPLMDAHVHLVEDNLDVQRFLRTELADYFKVTTSTDGAEAETYIIENLPDLVILDVMLPTKNGFDICKSLKSNPTSSHIPIIMLTAFKTKRHEARGLESGADDFISKPVSLKVLRLKVNNLLAARERLRAEIRKEYGLVSEGLQLRPIEKDFLENARRIVDENLSEEKFGADELATRMSMSRSSFYKKFKDLTGIAPGAFIRIKRLNKAAQLLAEDQGNITEVAFTVGFTDMSYFSRCFKEQFKVTPSKYKASETPSKAKPDGLDLPERRSHNRLN